MSISAMVVFASVASAGGGQLAMLVFAVSGENIDGRGGERAANELAEHTSRALALLPGGQEVQPDGQEPLRAVASAPAAGDTMLHLDHPQIAFGDVVVERRPEVVDEPAAPRPRDRRGVAADSASWLALVADRSAHRSGSESSRSRGPISSRELACSSATVRRSRTASAGRACPQEHDEHPLVGISPTRNLVRLDVTYDKARLPGSSDGEAVDAAHVQLEPPKISSRSRGATNALITSKSLSSASRSTSTDPRSRWTIWLCLNPRRSLKAQVRMLDEMTRPVGVVTESSRFVITGDMVGNVRPHAHISPWDNAIVSPSS